MLKGHLMFDIMKSKFMQPTIIELLLIVKHFCWNGVQQQIVVGENKCHDELR